MTSTKAPQNDELELSVFGPGRGECILVHLGYNEWCMIDSCIGRGQSNSAAIQYLEELGTNASDGVLLVVATHWHDDHIRGIASSLDSFKRARFACSNAIRSDHFLQLVELQSNSLQGNSGVDEFAKILRILVSRKPSWPSGASPVLALQDRLLFSSTGVGRAFYAKVTALSPSDETVRLALKHISQLIPQANQPQRRITYRPPNEDSVVLLIEVGGRTILLGADLEHSGAAAEGWLAILSSSQTIKTVGLSDIFKVAHHGSSNADCPDIWTKLLKQNPIAVLTPYTSGKGLPQPTDLQRLLSKTSHLYCTAPPRVTLPKRDKLVEKKLKNRKRVALSGKLGHVRLRWSVTEPTAAPEIEVFNGAFRVQ